MTESKLGTGRHNRTEAILMRTGYSSDRSGNHIPKFEIPPKGPEPRGRQLTKFEQELRDRIKELTKEASTFPPLENWL